MEQRDGKLVLEITPAGCYKPFKKFGKHITNYDILWHDEEWRKVALVVFTGGTDVNPSLYGEKIGEHTDNPDKARDEREQAVFYRANTLGIPMVGICRGSQFLCVMAGGKLIQHVTHHGGYHDMRTHDDRVIEVNSTHHQMQFPPNGSQILGLTNPRRSTCYLNGDGKEIGDKLPGDVEVVYYPNISAVGIQYHPEWLEDEHECNIYAIQVVEEFLLHK